MMLKIYLIILMLGLMIGKIYAASNVPLTNKPLTVTRELALKKFKHMYGSSHIDDATVIESDFTCDGVQDVFISMNHPDHLQGPVFEIMLVTGHAGKFQLSFNSMRYEAIDKKYGKGLMSLLKGTGSNIPTVQQVTLSKEHLDLAAKSEHACEKGVLIQQQGFPGLVYFFDKGVNFITKKPSYFLTLGEIIDKNPTYEIQHKYNIF